jgi:hypothetical protein
MYKKSALILFLALAVHLGATAAPSREKPMAQVGQLQFKITSVGIGVGATWGHGTLSFRGKTYPILVEGIELAKVGVAELEAVGRVYNLKSVEDIYGAYNKVEAGLAIVGGIQGMALRNAKGVVIDLTATQRGLSASLGIGSLQIKKR